ncbi:MAG: VOC family protein [Candidatus Bipolaricaulota bacterium]
MVRLLDAQIVFFPTPDLQATAEFYQGKLGLGLVLDQGACRIFRAAKGAFLGFCKKNTSPATTQAIITLVTEDVDGWVAELRGCGVQVEKEPQSNPDFQIYHAFLRDPNGYLVEIQRFDDPRWQANTQDD